MELEGLVAAVTGGAAGLGAAIVDGLRARGAHVVYGDLRDDRPSPPGTRYQHLDVRDRDSWDTFAETVRATHGRLDILVNNAGVSARADLLDTTDDDWDRVLRTNLWAPWTGIRAFAAELTASPHASVVNIGSVYGQVPPPA
ncbi:SDR family NAD(P)-dependent oxidoreductase, partial [Nonomuraea sp. SBT364]|uniref:SDR family NAD(P)-dependent oxidoreductase n=1 Tax=Nonomuraea sp. SBT364 TaxID=1580530 RepID=UPI00066B90D7